MVCMYASSWFEYWGKWTCFLGSDVTEDFGGNMYKRVEIIVRTSYIGGYSLGEFGCLNDYARRDYARGRDFG